MLFLHFIYMNNGELLTHMQKNMVEEDVIVMILVKSCMLFRKAPPTDFWRQM